MSCYKVTYRTRGEATKEAHKAHLSASPYKCPACGLWHLTSVASVHRTQRKVKSGKVSVYRIF